MKTLRRTLLVLLFLAAALPHMAFASVRITELMYDTLGAKTGREWVEVVNDTAASVDLKNYKLFQGSSNHGLTVVQGASLLPPQGVAVIAADANKFKTDWPGFAGTLFRSPFTLSSRGTSIILKDTTLAVIDTASYTPLMGAAGDGNSLHRSGDTFVAGAPDPGMFGAIPPPIVVHSAPSVKASPAVSPKKTTTKTPTQKTVSTQNSNTSAPQSSAAVVAQSGISPLWGSLLGLGALVVLGVAAAWYVRASAPTSSAVEEFTIE